MTILDRIFATFVFVVVCFGLAVFGLASATMATNPVSAVLIFITYAMLLGLSALVYWVSVIID